MSTLAVIGTFYRRPWALDKVERALRAQERRPDELLVVYEAEDDRDLLGYFFGEAAIIRSEPADANPISFAVNAGLAWADSDYITYLTDDSLPDPRKYAVMAQALDEHPEWGIVYCSQDYGTVSSPDEWLAGAGASNVRLADAVQADPYCRIDHTQVMHRRCKSRWPLDPSTIKLSDAHFFRDLVAELGPMYPIPDVLDWTRQLPDGASRR